MGKKLLCSCIAIIVLTFVGCERKDLHLQSSVVSGEVYKENGLPKNQKVTVRAIYPVAGYGKQHFEYAVKTFQEKFPNVIIDVRWVNEGRVVYKSIMQTLIQGGKEEEMYTLFPSFGNEITVKMALAGKLERHDDMWERNLYDNPGVKLKDCIMAEERDVTIEGHLYSIPIQSTIYGIYYNKKLFRKNGWKEELKDWNDFLSLCKQIKDYGIAPLVMAGKYPDYFTFGWGAIPFEVGGDNYINDTYNLVPDLYISDAYQSMLKKMDEFNKKDYLHPGTISFDHTQSQMEFLQGKAAMITNATWIANEMKNVIPEGFEWGFMPFPGNDNVDQKKVVLIDQGGGNNIWRNKPELEKKWAKEFNLWMLNMDVQYKIAQCGGVPTRKDFFTNMNESGGISASVIVALKKVSGDNNVKLINANAKKRVINNVETAKISKVILDGYISIIMGKKKPTEVADEINKQYMKGLNY